MGGFPLMGKRYSSLLIRSSIIFVLFYLAYFLTFSGQTDATLYYNQFNGHYYENFTDYALWQNQSVARAYCKNSPSRPAGTIGYLFTLTSYLEYQYAIENILVDYTAVYTGVGDFENEGIFRYLDGPEEGEIMYNMLEDRCHTFCPWQRAYPVIETKYNAIIFSSTTGYSGGLYNGKKTIYDVTDQGRQGFVCEYHDPNEISIIGRVPTRGGTVTIKNLVAGSSITFRNVIDDEPLDCINAVPFPNDASSLNCTIGSGLGSGAYKMLIKTPGSSDWTVSQAQLFYQTPYIISLLPALSNVVTIIGENFGVKPSDLTVEIGEPVYNGTFYNGNPCTNVGMINAHQYITCTLTNYKEPSPIYVNVNGISHITFRSTVYSRTQEAFFSVFTDTGIDRMVPFYKASTSGGNLPGQQTWIKNDVSRLELISWLPTYSVCIMLTGSTYFWIPVLYTSTGWKEYPSNTPITEPFRNTSLPLPTINETFPCRYGPDSNKIVAGDPINGLDLKRCNIGVYQPRNPQLPPNYKVQVPTTGGDIEVPLLYLSSYPGCSVTFQSQPRPCAVDAIRKLLYTTCPPTVGFNNQYTHVPGPWGGISLTFSVSAIPPSIQSVTKVNTTGGTAIVVGDNFYNSVASISIQVGTASVSQFTFLEAHKSFSFNIGAGAGVINIELIVGGQQTIPSPVYEYSYANPIITNFFPALFESESSNITVKGYNFAPGYTNAISFVNDANGNSVSCKPIRIIDDKTMECEMPNTLKSGVKQASMSVEGVLNEQPFPFVIYQNPVIDSIISPPVTGGMITIIGNGLANIDPLGINLNGTMTVQPASSPSYKISIQTACSPSSNDKLLICPVNSGTGVGHVLTIEFQYAGGFLRNTSKVFSYQPPTIDQATPIVQGKSGLVTIIGNNIVNENLTIEIANTNCEVKSVNTPTTALCLFNGLPTPPQNGSGMPVNVTVNGQSVTKSLYFYTQIKPCPSNCSDHGMCDISTGQCICDYEYDGISCNEYTPITIGGNVTFEISKVSGGTTIHTPTSSFNVAITHLREKDIDGKIVKTINMADVIWKDVITNSTDSMGNPMIYLSGRFPNEDVILSFKITLFEDPTTIVFANQNMSIWANSVKYNIEISGWHFGSLIHNLEILYLSQHRLTPCDPDTSTVSETWYEIYTGEAIMKARFSDRMWIDDTIVKSQLVAIPPEDPLYNDIIYPEGDTSEDYSNLLISISVPYFSEHVIIDPNFGSLLRSESEECGETAKWKIPVIVTFTILAAATLVAITAWVLKKKFMRIRMLEFKLKRFSKKS